MGINHKLAPSLWDGVRSKGLPLVTNYGEGGGATKREGGGHVKFYPYDKGGGGIFV